MLLLKVFTKKAIIFTILSLVFISLQSIESLYESQFTAMIIQSLALSENKIPVEANLIGGMSRVNAIWLVLGMSLGGFIFGILAIFCSSIAVTEYVTNLRRRTFIKIQTFSYKDIEDFSTSSLVTRLTNDSQTIFYGLVFGLRFLTKGLVLFCYGLGISIDSYPGLSIVYAGLIPLVLLVIIFCSIKAIPYFLKTQKNVDAVNNSIRQSVYGIRVLKAFNLEDERKEQFEGNIINLMKSSTKAFTIVGLLMPIIQTLVNMSIIIVYYIASFNPTSAHNIVGFVNILLQVLFGFLIIIMVFVQMASAIPSFRRVNEVLKKEISIKYNLESKNIIKNGDIEFKNVSYKFHESANPVLKNINLKIIANQKIGVIGRTGSGKSTLVNLLARLFDPTSGEIKISGKNIKNYSFKELNKNISIAMQEAILFSGTIKSNIEMGLNNSLILSEEQKLEEVKKAAIIAEAWEFIKNKPEQLNSEVEQRGKNFSGGQKQRISIARTVAKKSKIIIFDDSTSALDNITEHKVQKNMSQAFNATTIIVAQRISSVENLDKIIVIENGEITGFDTHKKLLLTNGIYRDIALSQWGHLKFEKEVKLAKKGVKNA